MAFNYKILPQAQEDLDAALEWYGEKGGQALKARFFNEFLKVRTRICSAPESYPFAFDT